mmetsp:Transcript_24576/g.53236  ORF Transcript_24576/g.53236 Transcript_24576/m.53236 type:complete len:108 (-) Transcript_24576:205-528(-)
MPSLEETLRSSSASSMFTTKLRYEASAAPMALSIAFICASILAWRARRRSAFSFSKVSIIDISLFAKRRGWINDARTKDTSSTGMDVHSSLHTEHTVLRTGPEIRRR